MSAIFLSHSSRDDAVAREVAARLKAQGHVSVFLDFDPEAGIPAGRDWEQELYQQLRACRAVVILCSRAAMASRWCFAEITHAKALGKHVFPLKVEPCEIDPILTAHQVLDLTTDPEDAFQRLWRGLTIAGLDPADAFDWDGRRAPYPGLLAFQEADAAIFFGREREIQEGLEQLQRLRQFGGARLALVLGASGSGKSSLVRAGLLPRLRRDPDRWLVVDPFRPGEEPLLALAEVFGRTSERLGRPQNLQTLRARLDDAPAQPLTPAPELDPPTDEEHAANAAALAALGEIEDLVQKPAAPELETRLEILRRALARTARPSPRPPRPALAVPGPAAELALMASELRRHAERPEATVLLVIDQFEELLTRPDAHAPSRFLETLRGLLEHPASPILILATLRSDFLGHLQRAPALVGARFDTLSVGPMAPEAIAQTIIRPAALAGRDLEPGLTEALVEDARAEDALPLLAFTLRELWERHQSSGPLRIAEYRDKLGGLAGSVARVADAVVDAARLSESQESDLRRSFLKLARLNEEGRFARQPARWDTLPKTIQPVLERFVEARLLVSREEGGARVLEVAHEALLRSWDRLHGWLDADREYLLWRKRLHAAFVQWCDAGHDDGALLRGVVLAESERWLTEHGDDLAQSCPELCRFIEASTALRRREESAVRRRRHQVLLAAASAATVFFVLALLAWGSFLDARRKSLELQAGLIVKTAGTLRDPVTSALLLLEAGEIFGGREPPGGARAARLLAGTSLARSVLHAHQGAVMVVAWSPDGTRVLSGSTDGTVRVWRADGTGMAVVLQGHGDAIRAAVWSPDGQRIATASADGTARVWRADGEGREAILEGHDGELWSLDWSPDGTRIATAGADGTARIWNADGTGEPSVLAGHRDAVRVVVWSPDGQRLLTTSQDATARVWNRDGGAPIVLAGHTDVVWAGRFSHDGRRVATAARDRTARIWDLAAPERPRVLAGHEGWVWNLDWSPDDTRVVTASADRTARVWDTRGAAPPIVLEGHDDWVRTALWSPDGRRVLTASHDGDARLWEVDTQREPKQLTGHEGWVRVAAWSPDGERVATGSDDKTARLWSTASETEPLVLHGHQDQVWDARFSHDDRRIASAAADRTLRLWNAEGGIPLGEPLRGHTDRVRSVDWSGDDTLLASGSDDDTARLWQPGTAAATAVLEGHEDRVLAVAWSHDGQQIATASADATVHTWALDGKPLEVLRGFGGAVRSVVWSTDDEELVTGADDDKVEVHRADGTGEARLVGQHRDQVMSVASSPDGQRVASASADRTAKIWSLDGKTPPIPLDGHEGLIWSIAWSPDGRRVVTAAADWTARVWNAAGTGDPIFLDGHEGPVWHAAFSHDGTRIVTASADWTVRIWKLWSLDWPALARHLRERTNACLPARERERYLGETHERAQERYERCEASYGRQAAPHEDE